VDRREPEILSRDARHLPGLLYYWTSDWKLSLSVLALTLWAIQLTLTIFKRAGGEMNFILGALAVMVMVFTLEASIHVIHYYKASRGARDPMSEACACAGSRAWCRCSRRRLACSR